MIHFRFRTSFRNFFNASLDLSIRRTSSSVLRDVLFCKLNVLCVLLHVCFFVKEQLPNFRNSSKRNGWMNTKLFMNSLRSQSSLHVSSLLRAHFYSRNLVLFGEKDQMKSKEIYCFSKNNLLSLLSPSQSLPPHTRKVTGSIPVGGCFYGLDRFSSVGMCLRALKSEKTWRNKGSISNTVFCTAHLHADVIGWLIYQ